MHALLLTIALCAAPSEAGAADTVVVCPPGFRQALAPWIEYRRGQGHKLAIIDDVSSPEKIRAAILRHARGGKLHNVLLVGDVGERPVIPMAPSASVPTFYSKAKVNIRWGSSKEIATDNPYADIDGDGVPDLSVGRLTADTPAQLTEMVRKIIRYEQAADNGLWRRRVNLVAGLGGFGPLVDGLLERAAKKFITDGIPAAYRTTMTYASWRSPFCPDPRRFHQATLDRHNEGCLFWVYMGHGQTTFLDWVRVPGGPHPIMNVQDAQRLRCAAGSPIAVMLACYTGAFDLRRDCLAEEMLRSAGGPVAVLSGSRVTMPYAMAVMSNDLLDAVFRLRHQTLGAAILHAKRQMAVSAQDRQQADEEDEQPNNNRVLLDALAAAISPAPQLLADERAEHMLLFNLLGDPLLRIRHPQPVRLSAASTIDAGQTLEVTGECATVGQCTFELVCRRDRTTFSPPVRNRFEVSDDFQTGLEDVYRQANDRRWASHTFQLQGGPFRIRLPIPQNAHGPCHVRIYVEGNRQHAMGATDVFVRRYREKR